jgi:hypothetical protein
LEQVEHNLDFPLAFQVADRGDGDDEHACSSSFCVCKDPYQPT